MERKKFSKLITTIFLTSLLALSLSSVSESVQAQASNKVRVGLPGRRVGGGTRGDCNGVGEKQLTALMPKNNLALTVAANPQLFFYLPAIAKQTVEFVLRDEADNQVYEKTFKSTGTNGIISINLLDSKHSKNLTVGKKYHWYLSVICNPQDRANDISVDGWIQRVEPSLSLTKKLEQAAPLQRLVMYEAANLWQDALTTLAQLRYYHPHSVSVKEQWTQLLRSVDLGNISKEPLKIRNSKFGIQN